MPEYLVSELNIWFQWDLIRTCCYDWIYASDLVNCTWTVLTAASAIHHINVYILT